MRKIFMSLIVLALANGCYFSVNDNDDDWETWEDADTPEERASAVCDPYCIDLIDCGALSSTAFSSCRDLCVSKFNENETAVADGCACIRAAECSPSHAALCEGDPLPGILSPAEDRDDSPVDPTSMGGSR